MSADGSPAPLEPAAPPAPESTKAVVLEPSRALGLLLGGAATVGLGVLLLLRGPGQDAQDVARLGFPLEPCRAAPGTLAAPADPDSFPPLDQARLLTAGEAAEFRLGRGKFLVPGDRVIGVVLNGEACAYPLRVLEWHEVLDSELGGVPIAVTYGALAECARVFDRRLGEETLELRPSGALANMSTLLYDRRPARAQSSLWSQLDGRAVTGPLAARGAGLRAIPAELVPWGAWLAAHPHTRVLAPDLRVGKLYKRNPYAVYMGRDSLPFPVAPLPPPGLATKARVLAVEAGGERRVYALERVAARVDANGRWEARQGDATLAFELLRDPARVQPDALRVTRGDGGDLLAVPALWFAWHAFHPQDPLAD